MTLDFRPFDLAPIHAWNIASNLKTGGGSDVEQVVLARLADKEVVGLGEAPCAARYSETVPSMQKFLRRVDAGKLSFDDIPGSMAYLEKLAPMNYSPKCAINVALLDGAARKAGKAIYDWLGLGFSRKKHLTSFSIGIDRAEVIRRKTIEASPYPVLKLKVGVPGDRENLAALREAAPDKTVRVDANEGWTTKEEALRNIEWLANDPHIEFIEQPMPAGTPAADLAWLKSRSPLPLFGDESYHHAGDSALCAECYHGVNVKLMKSGGISAACDALKAARKAGLKTMIGCMIETSVLISAAAHLAGLADHLDIDGNLLVSNDPYLGATAENGVVSFAQATEPFGLRVRARNGDPFLDRHSQT
jgi:L-alanine-DL-glutamate epimerase-like enolase superfamily enzyme